MKIAVIGASNDRSKFSNKIIRDLLKKGHDIYPVNPKGENIEGLKCYKNIKELPEGIDVINIVTPPNVTLEVLKSANELGLKNVWCQPGSSDDDIKDFLEKNGFKYITDSCIMIHSV